MDFGRVNIAPEIVGIYDLQQIRNGEKISDGTLRNSVTTDGLVAGLDALFFGGGVTQDWYLGLNSVSSPGGAAIIEEFTSYSEGTRPAWKSTVVSIGDHRAIDTFASTLACRVDCSTFAVYTCTATGFIGRPFLVNSSTKGSTIGTVWSVGQAFTGGLHGMGTARVRDGATVLLEAGNIIVWPGDEIKLGYSMIDYGSSMANTNLVGTKLFLDVFFKGTTRPTSWYVGLLTTGEDGQHRYDTMGTHPGWTEFTSYTGDRIGFSPVNSALLLFEGDALFTEKEALNYYITAPGTVGGFFLVDSSVKGATSGTLYTTGWTAVRRRPASFWIVENIPFAGDEFAVFKGERVRLRLCDVEDND